MEKVGCGTAPLLKKGKKKQAKDEVDRQKQAEKKRRRLEKALATSAAIRSELEMKKQKKKEEQQRLDEEGAAIAEAVALHVLVGEDTEESHHFVLNDNNSRYNLWDRCGNIGLFMGYQNFPKYSVAELGWSAGAYRSGCKWNEWEIERALPQGVHVRDLQSPFYQETCHGAEISEGLMAAQGVASLQIAEDSQEDPFSGRGAATVVINRMLRSSDMGDKVNFYKEF